MLRNLSSKSKIILAVFAFLFAIIVILFSITLFDNYKETQDKAGKENASQVLEYLQPAEDLDYTVNTKQYNDSIERFLSEYEMFKNDLSTGFFSLDNMSVSQAKIYNLTGITDRQGLENFENTKIDRKSKYPSDKELVKSIISIYSKDVSVTNVESGYSYWYSSSCGVIIYAPDNLSIQDLNKFVNKQGVILNDQTTWINLSK